MHSVGGGAPANCRETDGRAKEAPTLPTTRMTVLVTDAGYKHALGIIRALGASGHGVVATSSVAYSPGFFSRYAQAHVRTHAPDSNPGRFSEDLLAAIRTWNVNLVIPVGFASCAAVSRDVAGIKASGAHAIVPPPELFLLASDKWLMVEKAREAGLRVPETALVPDSQAATVALRARGPYGRIVLKYRRESLGQGASYVSTVDELQTTFRKRPVGIDHDGAADTIAQEYIPGIGAGYMALCWHGRVVREFAHRRLREWPPSGGAATAAESIRDDQLMDHGRRLVSALEWHGPAMVEFRVNQSGCYFIEFNPKFWGSLDLALAAGADFPGDLCQLADGMDLSERPIPSYQIGLRYSWPWRGDLRHLLRFRQRRLWSMVLADWVNPRVGSDWRWSDPVPNLIEIGGELLNPVRQWRRAAR